MTRNEIISAINTDSKILSLPQSLSEMLREMENPDFSPEKLADIILKDPAVTSRVLKLANSSFYRHTGHISTVHQAVAVLGMTTVRCLALSTSLFNLDRFKADAGVDARSYFTTILTVAATSQRIAKMCRYPGSEEALVTGLLHDVGSLYFIHHWPGKYRAVNAVSIDEALAKEREVFGLDRCEVGYQLAVKWHLPGKICAAIRDYRLKPENDSGVLLTSIVRLAWLLTHRIVEGEPEFASEALSEISRMAALIELTSAQVDEIVSAMPSWTLSIAEYLGLDIGDHEKMLVKANQKLWQTFLALHNLFRERNELSAQLLEQERKYGATEAKNIAIATLSHYLNNSVMAAYGRTQLIRMHLDKGQHDKIIEGLPVSLDVIERSIKRVVAVVQEFKEISPMDEQGFLGTSQAVNIDDRIRSRLERMDSESGLVLPDEAEDVL